MISVPQRCGQSNRLTVPSAQPDFVMSAGFTPADDEDYENYYRQQHLAEVARVTGWRKTERYELLSARENRLPPEEKTIPDPPKFLTLVSDVQVQLMTEGC